MSIRKLAKMLFLVNGLQFLLGAAILIGLFSGAVEFSNVILYLAICPMLLSSLLSMVGLFSVIRYQTKSFRESMENLERLNIRLREQRHDYLNQIQVVFGLLELGEYEDAREYLRPFFKEITKMNQALKTAQPAVNALLQAKMEEAGRQDIELRLEVGTQLRDLAMEPWEFCKILANLIDNAVTAVEQLEGSKQITLRLEEIGREYRIQVCNNGPTIPASLQKLIFGRGYTTKKEEGHGMGLAIVTDALKAAGGTITLRSEPDETCFTFTVPKRSPHLVNSKAKNDRLGRNLYK